MIKASNEKCPAANHKYMYLNGCLFFMAFTEVGFRFGTFQTGSNFNISVRRLENNISPGQKLCGEYYSHSYIILNISPPSAQNHLDFAASETTRSPLVLPVQLLASQYLDLQKYHFKHRSLGGGSSNLGEEGGRGRFRGRTCRA